MLLGDNNPSALKVEVDYNSRAESTESDVGLFDSLEIAATLATLAPPSHNR